MSDTQTAMVIEAVTHYKKKLIRHLHDEKGDVVLHCLAKLDRVPMTIEILQETGVGRIVNQLKKSTDPDSQVADEAKNIVRKWKEIVSSQEEEEERMNSEHQAPDSRGETNTEEDANTSSGPEDLEEEKSVPRDDSGSDMGPPILEPQIDSTPNKTSKPSKHSSVKERAKEKSDIRTEKSHDTKSHENKGRSLEGKKKEPKEEKTSSRSDKTKKHSADDKLKEHKSKHKSSKSHNEPRSSRDLSKEGENRKNGQMDKNGISKHSSSHHREKLHHSSEPNSCSSVANHKKTEKHKEKSLHSSHENASVENKGMFETAMLGADVVLNNKKSSKVKNGSEKSTTCYTNESFEDIGSRPDKLSRPIKDKSMDGDRINGNSLVNLNVPKDINPNYRPTNTLNGTTSSSTLPSTMILDTDSYMGKKKMIKTKVYSGGARRSGYTEVPKLFDMCIRVLQENLESIDECGGLPYDILEPVLSRAKPSVLMNIENYNVYLKEDTVELWQNHCKKNFPKEERKVEECESWREMYERCEQEKADKFTKLTEKTRDSYAKIKTDSRSTKLWDKGRPKPPRNVMRAQEKNGTAFNTPPSNALYKRSRPALSDPTRLVGQASSSGTGDSSRSNSSFAGSAPKKPKVAPMMAKTLKLARGLSRGGGFRR